MFASRVTQQVMLKDGVEDVAVVIRKLSALSLEKASEARTIAVSNMASRLGKETLAMFRETAREATDAAPKVEKTKAEKRKELFDSFDRSTVLVMGIQSWSSAMPLDAGVADLEEKDANDLKDAILNLSIPDEDELPKD